MMAYYTGFAASISPNRPDDDKAIDLADLLRLIRSDSKLDETILRQLGDLVYSGGGNELIAPVDDVRHGKGLSL